MARRRKGSSTPSVTATGISSTCVLLQSRARLRRERCGPAQFHRSDNVEVIRCRSAIVGLLWDSPMSIVHRVYNFSAGPAVMPLPALDEMQRDLLALPGVG